VSKFNENIPSCCELRPVALQTGEDHELVLVGHAAAVPNCVVAGLFLRACLNSRMPQWSRRQPRQARRGSERESRCPTHQAWPTAGPCMRDREPSFRSIQRWRFGACWRGEVQRKAIGACVATDFPTNGLLCPTCIGRFRSPSKRVDPIGDNLGRMLDILLHAPFSLLPAIAVSSFRAARFTQPRTGNAEPKRRGRRRTQPT